VIALIVVGYIALGLMVIPPLMRRIVRAIYRDPAKPLRGGWDLCFGAAFVAAWPMAALFLWVAGFFVGGES
jgi:hypothetical protein